MALAGKFVSSLYEDSPYFWANVFGIGAGLRKFIAERHYFDFRHKLRRLLQSQWYSKEQLHGIQLERLRQILRHAYINVPYYRRVFDEIGFRPELVENFDDIKVIPILTKDTIKKNYNDFIARNIPSSDVIHQATSGTTGSPFTILMNKSTLVWEKVWIQRHRMWGHYTNSDWRGSFGGHTIVPLKQSMPPFWRYNVFGKQILFSTYHMTPENLRHYVAKIRNSKICVVDGYPSTLYIFAKFLESRDIYVPMKAVFTGAEPIFDYQRTVIEDRFQCKIFDHYGLTEKVVSAGECVMHEGRHITVEGTFVEIVPISNTPDRNAFGEIIGTSLVNYAMPLIRYRTGDMSAFLKGDCLCGRKLPRIEPVETKMEDIITTLDGRYISASNLTFAFKPLATITEAQIIQDDLNNVRVRIVKGEHYSAKDTEQLLHGLQGALGTSLKIHIEFTDEIERTKTGKFRFVISRVPFRI